MEYIGVISQQLEKRVNCVETSSLGRVFDAVAAMLGPGTYNHFDAQLPMALEAAAAVDVQEHYEFELTGAKPIQLDLDRMLRQLVADVQKGYAAEVISAKFHNTLVAALLEMAEAARDTTRLDVVVLSGGVFCNRYLAERLIKRLKKADFRVLFNQAMPSNDGGISLGQAAIASGIVNGKTEMTSK